MAERKKALVLASVASMIDQFNRDNIALLQSLGYSVDVLADFSDPGNITVDRAGIFAKELDDAGVEVFDVAVPRALDPKAILSAYKKVKEVALNGRYDLMHCHSPIGGAIARVAFRKLRKAGTGVIYTAHGFHFYKGAPLKNWIVFYTTERWLSRFTDVLITINKEDFARAKSKFHARETKYVPGIGIDVQRFAGPHKGNEIRKELGIPEERTMILSVGELNKNKNHETVIRALQGMDVTYVIVGKGVLDVHLKQVAEECGVDTRFTGFRSDIVDFYDAADLFILPSIREGLNVSLMEAMASGLPVACSRIRGNVDLVDEDKGGVLFDPKSVESVSSGIKKVLSADRHIMSRFNLEKIEYFSRDKVREQMSEIYGFADKDDICIIRAKLKEDYVFDAIKHYGYKTCTPYVGNALFPRIMREIWFRTGLPHKDIWYNKDINGCKTYIVFDPLILPEYLEWIHTKDSYARIILVYENRAAKTIDPAKVGDYVEKWSYDKEDCRRYSMKWNAPSFFMEYIRKPDTKVKYDVLYVGRDKGRAEKIFKIEEELKSKGLSTYFHICADRQFMRFKKRYYKKLLPYDEYLDLLE